MIKNHLDKLSSSMHKLKILLICDFPNSFFSSILSKKIINFNIEISSTEILGVLINLQRINKISARKYDIIIVWSEIKF